MRGVTTMIQKEFIKYIFAAFLGDSGLYIDYRNKSPNAYFQFSQCDEHKDYIDWMKNFLEGLTSVRELNTVPEKGRPYTRLITKTHPTYTKIYKRCYLSRHKVIDPHYLKLVDWECLARWYMDDGSLLLGNSKYPTNQIKIYSQAFSYGDNFLLKKYLKETFDLEFNINKLTKGEYFLYFLNLRSIDFIKFIDGIGKYIFPSFEYKLGLLERYRTNGSSEVSEDGDIV